MLATKQRCAVPTAASRKQVMVVKAISTPATPGGRPNSGSLERVPTTGRKLRIFRDDQGNRIKPMTADFGFRSGVARMYDNHDREVPKSFWELASVGVEAEVGQLRASYRFKAHFQDSEALEAEATANPVRKAGKWLGNAWTATLTRVDEALESVGVLPKLEAPPELTPDQVKEFRLIRAKLRSLRLDSEGVDRREAARIAATGDLDTPAWVKLPFLALSWTLDRVYARNPISKFWVLETVARVPYNAYSGVLHLYESLGFWRAGAELRKVHFAEEWNELHHLQIMESLGGDQAWFDRFFAEHAAILYWWVLTFLYLVNPKLAYNFGQRVEHHASDTYTEFLETNREVLATIPPPQVALNYYLSQDLYLFDEFQSGNQLGVRRRPPCNNLLDVFVNIRDDEDQHVVTMAACQTDGATKLLPGGNNNIH